MALNIGVSLTGITFNMKNEVSVKVSSAIKITSITAEPVQFSTGDNINESEIILTLTSLVSLEITYSVVYCEYKSGNKRAKVESS